jgi:hypothetical protein
LSNSKVESNEEKIKPPYGAVQSYSDFFDLNERIKIDKVDTQFIDNNNIASKTNEYKIVLGLKFLGLLNEDGTVTEKMKTLNVVGEEFKKNLERVVREAYSALFDTFKGDIQKAKPQDIVNCLRGDNYQMSPTMAKEGAKVFAFLAQRAGIPLSPELAVSQEKKRETKQKEPREKREPKGDKRSSSAGKPEGDYALIPEGMIRMEYQNKVLMFLPKGDKKTRELTAKIAKQFIETYEAESSEEDSSMNS